MRMLILLAASSIVFTQLLHVSRAVTLPGCTKALGMESGAIENAQITASHWLYNTKHYTPSNARLNSDTPSGGWCSAGIEEHKDQYIQIDLLKNTKLTSIATQGRSINSEYIEKFQLMYQRDGEDFFHMYNESGVWKEFPANKDVTKIAKNVFSRSIVARTIRIIPRGDEFAIYCGRFELYGCKWSHQMSTLKSYSAPIGAKKNGVSMEDSSYDGMQKLDGNLYNGLGKLTDDIYGEKEGSTSAWVAYRTAKPEMTFHFSEKTLIKQIMIHVNNNNKDVKVFESVEILASDDDITYTSVKTYVTDKDQRNKIDGYAIVCNVGEVVAKHLRLRFTKRGNWLLISEVVFMTDSYPMRPVILVTESPLVYTAGNPTFALKTLAPRNKNEFDGTEGEKKEKKGLSFPIILTIALVTIVLAVVVAIFAYKTYKKNKKPGSSSSSTSISTRSNTPQPAHITNNHKQDSLALLAGDERYMAAFHQQQPGMKPQSTLLPHQNTLLPQSGMYFQPPMHQTGYNTKIMMS